LNSLDDLATLSNHIVVVGAHQMGQSIIRALENSGEEVLVVDFDPNVVEKLRGQGIHVIFGDIADTDIQERLGFEKSKLVISTVPDLEDNLLLIEGLKHVNKNALVVVMALETYDAKALYEAGADYVILPHLAGGRHIAKMLIDKRHLELIEEYKKKDLAAL
jgi:Trk K+ transport system NAD-binding subunit